MTAPPDPDDGLEPDRLPSPDDPDCPQEDPLPGFGPGEDWIPFVDEADDVE